MSDTATTAPTEDDTLHNLLARKEWLLRDRFEKAKAANQAVHDKNVASVQADPGAKLADYPFSEDEMVQMELDMLEAQIELEQEEQ